MYFIVAIISEQELTKDPRLIIPIILILKLIFFFGWLEVAKAIDDPWDGKDYEDFKVATCEIGQNHLLSLSSLHSNWLKGLLSQIRELISRHFWSVGRSLQQESAQVITLQTKAT